ncbi:hypothetical protein GN157_02285 [Flavobacterium rakeshii]|uniref:Toxin-antitoxin system YwqK family antitoxin n=1 Tax=Flavobacterium rakeshii TaxID=1038845 RepID=A0A6N8HBH1_9FLAO|nr:hypothetical protein [Flavobacterium rakeshii]MEE1899992.1 hypothetical protein [Flavobacterium rakeshii]MUV02526.1 hypothetical protein [Flavobacterium rakeshii]
MKKSTILYLLLMLTICSYGQERVKSYQLYSKKGLTYKKTDNTLFNGISEFKRERKNHIVFEEYYHNGIKTKYIEYYNTDEVIVCKEIIYHENSPEKKKFTKFSLDGKRRSLTYYDLNGKKELEETYRHDILTYRCEYLNGKRKFEEAYKNDVLVYSCEYLNGKKHGKKFCITKKHESHTEFYENGKKVSR